MKEFVPALRRDLRPLFEMLKHKEGGLPYHDWSTLVKRVQQSVTDFPEQYLSNYPEKEVLVSAVDLLFSEFIEESA